MATIEKITAIPAEGGFFFDDQDAIKELPERSEFDYAGEPLTPGFEQIRQQAKAMSILLRLSNGTVVAGDCAAVQYSGAGGRDSVFHPDEYSRVVESDIAAELSGCPAENFLENLHTVELLIEERDLNVHTAVHYGLSQALLKAAASARQVTVAETVVDCFGTTPAAEPVPVYAQTGDERRVSAEKMILKSVDVLPHGLFNSVPKIGESGEVLIEYLSWLSSQIASLGAPDYKPRIHVDVYGILGDIFGPPYDRPEVMTYFKDLNSAAEPYDLQIEGPIDAGSRSTQIATMLELRTSLASAGIDLDIVADEWCNTLEDIKAFVDAGAADLIQIKTPDLGGIHNTVAAVQYCDGTESKAYIGGSCAETDLSARVSAQVAIGTAPAQVLAKPGMGVDEGLMIVRNEMRRAIAMMDH